MNAEHEGKTLKRETTRHAPAEPDIDGPDTEIARNLIVGGLWLLTALMLWGNLQRSRLAALEAQLNRKHASLRNLDLLRRPTDMPVEPLAPFEPQRENYDSDEDYRGALNAFVQAMTSFQERNARYASERAAWLAETARRTADIVEERRELSEDIRSLRGELEDHKASLGGFSRFHLWIKGLGIFLLLAGLFATWITGRRAERTVALIAFTLFALRFIQMAFGYGNVALHLDAIRDLLTIL